MESENSEISNESDGFKVNALHIAAYRGDQEMVQALLDKNPGLLNSKDVLGQTALHYAVRSYSHEIVEFLLKYKSSFPLEINSENQFGQTAFYYAAHLLHCLAFPGNIDNLDFLPLHVEKISLTKIIDALISAKAQPSHLNYYVTLPACPTSVYLDYDPSFVLGRPTQQTNELKAIDHAEQEKVDHRKAEALRFHNLINRPKIKDPEDEEPIHKKKKSTETPSITPWGVQEEDNFFSVGSKSPDVHTAKASILSSPIKIASAKKSVSFNFGAQLEPQTQSSFEFEPTVFSTPVPRQPTDWNSTPQQSLDPFAVEKPLGIGSHPSNKYIPAMEEKAKSFTAGTGEKPKTIIGRVLLSINQLHQSGQLTLTQKNALKTAALRNDNGIKAALLVYEINEDRSEYIDTLQKISHLSHAA